MKLYEVTDEYIEYLKQFDNKVYDTKEGNREVKRKYLGIVLSINDMNYYVPLSSPKKSDFKENRIRKSIPPIIRIVYKDKNTGKIELKGTLRIGNMIPIPESELIYYDVNKEENSNYQILVKKELNFIEKNITMIKEYATIVYNQKVNNRHVSYENELVDYKLLEDKCKLFKVNSVKQENKSCETQIGDINTKF